MEKATKVLNMFSAGIVLITGMYIQSVFDPVLSLSARVIIWVITLTYAAVQTDLRIHIWRRMSGALSGDEA